LVAGEFRLFANLKTGVASEKKRAVTASQMQKLVRRPGNRELSPKVCQAQDTLSLMILLQGMPYTDLAHLHKNDLNGELLTCHRRRRVRNFVESGSKQLRLTAPYNEPDSLIS
jgi:hypothetical protein